MSYCLPPTPRHCDTKTKTNITTGQEMDAIRQNIENAKAKGKEYYDSMMGDQSSRFHAALIFGIQWWEKLLRRRGSLWFYQLY